MLLIYIYSDLIMILSSLLLMR